MNSTEINTIEVDPGNPNVVVVATGDIASMEGGGIYKTINGGQSWQETYPDGGNYLTYYNGQLYAASYHAILKSSNFGTTWQVIYQSPAIVTTMAIAGNGSTLFAGTFEYNYVSIIKSIDNGRNFRRIVESLVPEIINNPEKWITDI